MRYLLRPCELEDLSLSLLSFSPLAPLVKTLIQKKRLSRSRIFYGGMEGTRTLDLLRDRQAF